MFNLFKKKKTFIVDVSFAKTPKCKSIRARYDKHRGDKISNSFCQVNVTVYDYK
jgi:ribosomal protein S6E (S10)